MALKSEVKINESLTLYADQGAGQLYLKLISGQSTEAKLSVIDMAGHTKLERKIPTNQLTFIPLNDIDEGIYIAQVEYENNILTEKFRF